MDPPKKGMQFSSYGEFKQYFQKYQDSIRQLFVTRTSITVDKKLINHRNINAEKFPYYRIEYWCKYGPNCKGSKAQCRKTSTYKQNCPAVVNMLVSKNGKAFYVKHANLEHHGHNDSELFYDFLPEKRRLSEESKGKAAEMLAFKCDKKRLQTKLIAQKGKQVQLKDLTNINSKFNKDSTENNLKDFLDIITKNGGEYKLLVEKKVLKGVYISTPDMRVALQLWPEMVFIDGTYKLTNINFVLMLLVVEDSNGLSRIVGVGLLASEDEPTISWFLTHFRDENSDACSGIKSFMSDKEFVQRMVYKKLFPTTNLYICIFHTLQIFSRKITTEKLNISSTEKKQVLSLLENLVYSRSEDQYERFYAELCSTASASVIEYYNKHWHGIREEWSLCLIRVGNMKNNTNNRMESINAKIKQVVQKNSSLVEFGEALFVFFDSQRVERDRHTAIELMKQSTEMLSSCEIQYADLLTKKGFSEVMPELQSYTFIDIISHDAEMNTCTFRLKGTMVVSDLMSCKCEQSLSMMLPCRHIFATRHFYKEPLFWPELCANRWKKEYCIDSFKASKLSDENKVTKKLVVSKVKRTETESDLQTEFSSLFKNIVYIGSLACNQNFCNKFESLKQLVNSLNESMNVSIVETKVKPIKEISGLNLYRKRKLLLSVQNSLKVPLSKQIINILQKVENFWKMNKCFHIVEAELNDNNGNDTSLSESDLEDVVKIQVPQKIKVQGKPCRGLDTYIKTKKT